MMFQQDFVYALLAAFGGIAKYLAGFLRGDGPVDIVKLAAATIVSGFTGYIAAQVAVVINSQWASVAAGVFGWLGAEGMVFLFDILKVSLRVKNGDSGEHHKK